ncbi:hypothetical protein UFOVP1382_22 [uncultured Caudovirales phage]|uniref:Uncharacterized protein n=1 Tax=uncultured Caudovirales phage TaxID=2100421 RepID=A0A6J5S526_9CAUD|nr:hypothetical protein UFOVP1382_22 [uncultured Caudovirales phage]
MSLFVRPALRIAQPRTTAADRRADLARAKARDEAFIAKATAHADEVVEIFAARVAGQTLSRDEALAVWKLVCSEHGRPTSGGVKMQSGVFCPRIFYPALMRALSLAGLE